MAAENKNSEPVLAADPTADLDGTALSNLARQNTRSAPMDKLWEEDNPERAVSDKSLVLDLEGFEGPLDLLLHLARTQKVDLAKISVLELAVQYLEFIENARKLRLELAADYLVMAAWLAFLKSKLLIPQYNDEEDMSGEEMAQQLAFRLKRLEAMREAATRLINRNRLGRDVFARGMPEPIVIEKSSDFSASLYDLLTAYASQRQRNSISKVTIARRKVWSLKDARGLLLTMVKDMAKWTSLDSFLIKYLHEDGSERRTAMASSFAASLEMVREGHIDMRQDGVFTPIFLRRSTRSETNIKTNIMADANIAANGSEG